MYEFPRMRGLASMLDPVLSQLGAETALVFFDTTLTLARDFTSDADLVKGDLNNLQSGDGGAAILDAVQYSLRLLNKTPEGRQRVVLLISETRDHGSHFAKIDDIVTLVGNSNITAYTLAFSPTLSNILDTERGNNQDEMNPSVDLIALLAPARAAMKSNTPKAIASQTGGEYELFESRERFETRMMDFHQSPAQPLRAELRTEESQTGVAPDSGTVDRPGPERDRSVQKQLLGRRV